MNVWLENQGGGRCGNWRQRDGCIVRFMSRTNFEKNHDCILATSTGFWAVKSN